MSRRITLWHPDSPGTRVEADVHWPRSLWVKRPHPVTGQPRDVATLSEAIAAHKREQAQRVQRVLLDIAEMMGHRPDDNEPLITHAEYVIALGNAMERMEDPRRPGELVMPVWLHAEYRRAVEAARSAREREREVRP